MSNASVWAAFANAHAVLANSCGLKSRALLYDPLVNAAKNSAFACVAVANTHAVLTKAWILRSAARPWIPFSRRGEGVPLVSLLNGFSPRNTSPPPSPMPQNAMRPHGMPSQTPTPRWQKSCGVKSRPRLPMGLADAAMSNASAWAAVANAHAVLDISCGLKSCALLYAALANAAKKK